MTVRMWICRRTRGRLITEAGQPLSLATFWSLGLLVAAYNTWVKSGYLTAILVVLTPHGLIYGIWAMVALS